MSRWDEGLVPKWLSIDRDGFFSIYVRHPDFIRSFKDKFKDFGDVKEVVSKMESTNSCHFGNGWISVDERLPNGGVTVLAYTNFGDIFTCRRPVIEKTNATTEPKIGVRQRYTHWQPLPEPPMEVKDD